MHKTVIMLSGVCFSIQAWAFPCFVTLVKDSCWLNYNVTMSIVNATTGKLITSIIVPEGQSWTRASFACQPRDTMSFSAIFTPVFWETDKGKIYPGQHDWQLPQTINAGETAWNINVCYPAEFAEVPMPPEANNQCKCDMAKIPPVKPQ